MYNNNDFIKETISFDCSLLNCQKDALYKIKILNEEKSLGEFTYLETEELKAEHDNSKITFKTLSNIEYCFSQRQLLKIKIMKKNINSLYYDNYERLTLLSSLVNSPNSIYERNVNENETNSEKMSIEVKTENNIMLSEIQNINLLDYFKKGGKIKLLFFIDFTNKDYNNDYFKAQNIFFNLIVKYYNYFKLYTAYHEVYIYGTKEDFDSSINSISSEGFTIIYEFQKIREYFLNSLNKENEKKQLYISAFIENSIKEIELKAFNVMIIFIMNLPEDIKLVIDKMKDVQNEKKPMNIILINTGYKFSNDLNNRIKECSNIILFEIQDDSLENLENIVQISLNEIGKNIIEYRQNQQYSGYDMNNSENYGNEYYDDEGKEENVEENKTSSINFSISYNNKVSQNMGKKKLNASGDSFDNIENPYSKNIYIKNPYSQMRNNSIKESENESDSEYNKKDKEINEINIENKNISKDPEKVFESKMVDSKAKTDSSSFNNKIFKSKNFFESDG